MSPDILFENIDKLPPIARQEVFDFVSFLVQKYNKEITNVEQTDKVELTESGKKFIDKRLALMQSNPKSLSSWDDVKGRLFTKYNWK
ncbi:MAG: DUF2281 domain-containing protein [Leptospiraceae bacterium]|nr:DUF2281 domain-containing protein [Leptospiraceae bacterium]